MNEPILFAGDVSILAELHADSFDEAWSEASLRALLETPGTFAHICSRSGFILARTAGGEAEILTLAVAQAARRQGVGLALVAAAARYAQQLGATTMFLEVGVSNDIARALYARCGFREVGTRKAYYSAEGGNALILRADLPLAAVGKQRQVD